MHGNRICPLILNVGWCRIVCGIAVRDKGWLRSQPWWIRFKLFLSPPHHLFKHASIQIIIQIMGIPNIFVLFAIILKCVVASGDTLEIGFKGAVDGKKFEVVNEN